jgi:ABC-type glutathione transport system ATPase component
LIPLLRVENLTICYRSANAADKPAVDNISFHIEPGESVGIIGESGCGKTSTVLALLGLLSRKQADISGSAIFRGEDLLTLNDSSFQAIRGNRISMVYQEPGISLSPVMRVGTQIAEVARAHRKWDRQQCRAKAFEMLDRVGLPPTDRIFSSYPHQLSGGQLQRIVLAQALICEPELVIADEPTASLDAQGRAGFIELLRELARTTGLSLLLISHTPEIQASLVDRLLVMKDGEIVEAGGFDDVYRSPCHPVTKLLLHRSNEARAPHETALDPVTQDGSCRLAPGS